MKVDDATSGFLTESCQDIVDDDSRLNLMDTHINYKELHTSFSKVI